jgi:predicted site-specific integrase-resolvase
MINGVWLSINEYSTYRGISISTIRRYIKAKRVQYKLENRKYYIYVSKEQYERRQGQKGVKESDTSFIELYERVAFLEKQLQVVQEENHELKMLIDIYEGKQRTVKFPEFPETPLIC